MNEAYLCFYLDMLILKRYGLIWFITATWHMTVFGQQAPIISHFTVRNGLAENKVTDGIMTPDGLFWFTTGTELNRFDGYNFTIKPIRREKGYEALLPARRLLLQEGHRIYTLSGGWYVNEMICFSTRDGSFHTLDQDKANPVLTLFSDDSGQMYQITSSADLKPPYQLSRLAPDFSKQALLQLSDAPAVHLKISELPKNVCLISHDSLWEWAPEQKAITVRSLNGTVLGQFGQYYAENGRTMPFEADILPFFYQSNQQIWLHDARNHHLLVFDGRQARWVLVAEIPHERWLTAADQYGNFIFENRSKNQPAWWRFESETRQWYALPAQAENFGFIGTDFRQSFFAYGTNGLYLYRFRTPKTQVLLQEGQHPMRGIVQTEDGSIYAASEADGIYKIDPVSLSAQLTPKSKNPDFQYIDYHPSGRLVSDGEGSIWFLTERGQHLYRFHWRTNEVERYPIDDYLFDLLPPQNGHILISGIKGLYQFDLSVKQATLLLEQQQLPVLQSNTIFTMLESKDRRIWLGTTYGLYCFDPNNKKIIPLPGLDALNAVSVSCLTETTDGALWIGTLGQGLYRYLPNGAITHYNVAQGLCNAKIASLLPDGENLWISTYNGLSYFAASTRSFFNFYEEDGLSHQEFNRRSAFRSADGRFWFGSLRGITTFYRDALLPQQHAGLRVIPVQFSFFKEEEWTILQDGLEQLKEIHLPATQRYCELYFAVNDFTAPGNNQFAYMLEGLDPDWRLAGTERKIAFDWLPAGDYQLLVKAATPAGQWSEPYRIRLIVDEVFYRTWYFWLGLAALILAIGMWLGTLYRKRAVDRRESERLRELDELKTRLYDSITHEFRTPLTLILGYADRGMEQTSLPQPVYEQFGQIRLAGRRLLQLVNQILDLSKLRTAKMPIHWVQGDVVAFLQYRTESFQSYAEKQELELHFASTEPVLSVPYDQDLLQKIHDNLISNAIRFTPKGGKITVMVTQSPPYWKLIVQDSGQGIPADELAQIFDYFKQASNNSRKDGTGIGLSLVQEIVKLWGGKVEVSSQAGLGARFTINLPLKPVGLPTEPLPPDQWLTQSVTLPDIPINDAFSTKPADLIHTQRPRLLLVEDNSTMSAFITQCLDIDFDILHAENGETGWDSAVDWLPDIVLSDVMMPKKDGLELLDLIKNDTRTSHIPVVLLSAKSDIHDRLEGLRRGANAYLPKPFHAEELRLALFNLLDWNAYRERYAQLLVQDNLPEPADNGPWQALDFKVEDAFVAQIVAFIESRIDDPDLAAKDICRAVGISNTHLNRKLTVLTGHSVNWLVRTVRLRRACQLLRESPELTIAEIGYRTGFSAPGYFTKVFTAELGQTPTEWRENH